MPIAFVGKNFCWALGRAVLWLSWIWSGYKMQQSCRQSVHRKLLGMTSNMYGFLKLAKFYAHVD